MYNHPPSQPAILLLHIHPSIHPSQCHPPCINERFSHNLFIFVHAFPSIQKWITLFLQGWSNACIHYYPSSIFTVTISSLHLYIHLHDVCVCVCIRVLGSGPPPQAKLCLHPGSAVCSRATGDGRDASGLFPLPAGWLETGDPGHVRRTAC